MWLRYLAVPSVLLLRKALHLPWIWELVVFVSNLWSSGAEV